MQLQEINENVATAAVSGTSRKIYLDVLDEEAKVGDYVIVHAGFAIHKIDEEEARETLRLFEDAGFLVHTQEDGEAP
jgi:hydrogenase expression/formation protein HypC